MKWSSPRKTASAWQKNSCPVAHRSGSLKSHLHWEVQPQVPDVLVTPITSLLGWVICWGKMGWVMKEKEKRNIHISLPFTLLVSKSVANISNKIYQLEQITGDLPNGFAVMAWLLPRRSWDIKVYLHKYAQIHMYFFEKSNKQEPKWGTKNILF